MAAELEKLAELAAKGGYKNWATKLRAEAKVFREAGGPEFFVEPQTTESQAQPTQRSRRRRIIEQRTAVPSQSNDDFHFITYDMISNSDGSTSMLPNIHPHGHISDLWVDPWSKE